MKYNLEFGNERGNNNWVENVPEEDVDSTIEEWQALGYGLYSCEEAPE